MHIKTLKYGFIYIGFFLIFILYYYNNKKNKNKNWNERIRNKIATTNYLAKIRIYDDLDMLYYFYGVFLLVYFFLIWIKQL